MRIRTAVTSLVLAVGVAVPAAAAVEPVERVSEGASPLAAGCAGRQPGRLFPGSEVEPFVAVNPARPSNAVAVWQQDRWSNGGAQGLLAAYSDDGGATWTPSAQVPFSRCTGGTRTNGGHYQRASDPWVTFSPDGSAYFMSLSVNLTDGFATAMLVARSVDGGRTWEPPRTLIRDTDPAFFNDKNSITADPTDSRYVYAVWDRLAFGPPGTDTFTGPTWFSRTTDGGRTWEPARAIYDPGPDRSTIGNQVAVLPDGTLVNVFAQFRETGLSVAVIRSTDKGVTWSAPVVVNALGTVGVVDPRDGAFVRTGDVIPDIAVDPRPGHDDLYVVWQDARFTGGARDQVVIARSGDGGRHWSAPRRVSSNVATQAFTASVDVSPAGGLLVTYYDFTYDTATDPLETDHWAAKAVDGIRAFGPRERLTPRSFNMRKAPYAGGFFVGDYSGLASEGSRFSSVFGLSWGAPDSPSGIVSARLHRPYPAPTVSAPSLGRATVAPTRRFDPSRFDARGPLTAR
jgi:BNR/Asp-box repeat